MWKQFLKCNSLCFFYFYKSFQETCMGSGVKETKDLQECILLLYCYVFMT